MEMQEKKKFMPAITNYLSDDDDFEECLEINSNAPQLQTNYAEWKRLQKSNHELSNGKKPRIRSDGSMEPLGDVSSSDENFVIEDNEPMFKVIKTLSEREGLNCRTQRNKKKSKEPSSFLLFSRMKHAQYQQNSQDWTFNELCRITHSAWENIQPSENQELSDTMDQRIREYKDILLKFRSVLLPDSSGKMKYKSWVSAAVANKQHLECPVSVNARENTNAIPERLHNLVGKASVYHATAVPAKANNNARHSLFSYRSTNTNNNDYSSDTSLNYVANVVETCKYEQCMNKPVQDCRWDGQYCSAKCLINDCRDTFQNWLADQKQISQETSESVTSSSIVATMNGDKSRSSSTAPDDDNDDEIMQYLATPAENNSDSDDSISRDENLFASLQQHYFPRKPVVDITRSDDDDLKQPFSDNDYCCAHITDMDDELAYSSQIKLHSPKLSSSTATGTPNHRNNSVAISSNSDG